MFAYRNSYSFLYDSSEVTMKTRVMQEIYERMVKKGPKFIYILSVKCERDSYLGSTRTIWISFFYSKAYFNTIRRIGKSTIYCSLSGFQPTHACHSYPKYYETPVKRATSNALQVQEIIVSIEH